MKKLSLLLVFSLFFAIAGAQTVEKTYFFNEPTINQIQGYEQIQLEGCMQSALAGQPCLPWQSVSLMLPEGHEAASIEVVLSDFHEIEGTHNLFPYQPARAFSDPERHEFLIDESVYQSKSTYPVENHGMVTTHYKNGYGFAFSSFSPVQYLPASGTLRYAAKATVRVHLAASKASHQSMVWNTPTVLGNVKRLAQNPEMAAAYQTRGRDVTAYDLLIITSPEFVEAYNEYCNYYNGIGLRNRIATTTDIYSTTSGIDNQDKIRNYIIQEYQENGILMVVLGGDVNIVPYRGFYCHVTSGGGDKEDYGIPADFYYSALDGNWNDDGDNRWGEPGEDDLLPEIGISRMSFKTDEELQHMIHKTLSYQQDPVLGEFRKIVLAGEHLYDNPTSNGSDYLELLIGTHDDNGYTTTCYPTDYNFIRLYEEQNTWSSYALRQAINSGVGYVHHDGHANSGYVAGWWGISNSDFNGANGTTHNYTFFHSQGCDCGAFDQSCILEKMVTIENFAVAVIGNSRYGWFNEGQTEGPGAHLEREMTDAQFNDRIGLLGCAISEGKTMTAPWVTAPGQWEEGALRWNFYDMNVLGDGAVNVWLDEPFHAVVDCPEQVVLGAASMQVGITDPSGQPQRNFRCQVYVEDEVIAMATTDANGIAEIVFEGGLQYVGEMKMKIMGVNAFPEELTLMALPDNAPYVIYESHTLCDGVQQIDFDGQYAFDVVVKNVGNVSVGNVTATLSADNANIIVTQPTHPVGTINGNQSLTLSHAFEFRVSDSIPNNTKVRFFLQCTDGNEVWESHFDVRVYAPAFELVSVGLENAVGGSNLNPGDNGTVHFVFRNLGGTTVPSAQFDLQNPHPELITPNTHWTFPALAPNEEFAVDLSIAVNTTAEEGNLYRLPYSVQYGNYRLTDAYYLPIGTMVEDFESGTFSAFDWHHGSIVNAWEVVGENPYEGRRCARSAAIGDNETSVLYVDLQVACEGEMSFYYKVSSEYGYDKLYFKIDNETKGSWSGNEGWAQASYMLTPGSHRLQWEYSKDVYLANGSDCAWIDYVVLPASHVITLAQETVQRPMALYPNPNQGRFCIDLPEAPCQITVHNSLGQLVYRLENAVGTTTLNLDMLPNGLYFLNVISEQQQTTQKFIKE